MGSGGRGNVGETKREVGWVGETLAGVRRGGGGRGNIWETKREGEGRRESWGGVGVEGALGRGRVGRRDSCVERVLRVCI